jgi:phosphatidylinositol alpha-1,6-mannosyltransferase
MERRPRVLVLTPDFPPAVGGIQHLLHRVVSGWQRVDATVVTLGPPPDSGAEPERFDVVRVGRGLAGHRADVARINARALRVARSLRPDVVLSGHVVTAPAAVAVEKLLGVPYVQYLYGQEIAMRKRTTALAISRARAVIAISRFTAEYASSIRAHQALRLIPPGVDLPAVVPSHQSNGSRRTIVTVSRLVDRYKGHDTLLRALPLVAARVPDVRWVVVGDGSLLGVYERGAAALGVDDRVVFAGAMTNEERDRWLDSADVFAMVARLSARGAGEGFGIVYLEAGAHGLPVVAGRAGGTLDAVVDGETGVLVDPEDHVAVALALTELLLDPERARRMGAAGRALAEKHAWPLISAQVEDVLLDIASPA